ncbi:MAG: ATP-dependent RNA helicase HrpA [Planctomycetaceae bacterium]|nr:ATP-dependent RNA helicase HrpA [Planctomycetaceae bacterium]
MKQFSKLKKEISRVMLADRFRLGNRLRQLERESFQGRDVSSPFATLENDVAVSFQKVEQRRKNMPRPVFDESLPINERRKEIAEIIRENQVTVLCGETGSGKSTQIPKICLDIGRGLYGIIGHTQPRRIAARSVAARIAEELGTPLGGLVGYKVRFADQTSPDTLVKLMTDGILLAESQNDKYFEQYDTIIIDEAHERSLNIDFLLGMMRRLVKQRRDLKLIITSATIDAARFAAHFSIGNKTVPVIEVSGRTYPIEVRYRPMVADDVSESDDDTDDTDPLRAVLKAVDELAAEGRGDMLVFMPTERDILETAKLLRSHTIPGDPQHKTEILPLYARLPVEQQQRIFKTSVHRRIVIATNVAESSLTVPGIRYVIDTGTARLSRYSARSRTQRLPIEPISQASADQRAGRCGRLGPGICVRLYGKSDYDKRDRYTTPEIQRTNLASVILQTKSLKLGAVEKFPFLDPPRSAAIADGYKTLYEIGAIDDKQELTAVGRQLGKLPVDPRIGRMILAAGENGVLREMLIVAAALEVQDPRERPHELQEKADAAHQKFLDPQSDFLAYLNIWNFYHGLKEKLSQNQLRKACRQNFLSYNRMREWSDIHLQLKRLQASDFRLQGEASNINPDARSLKPEAFYDNLHRSILAGMLSGIAERDQKFEYNATGGGKFFLWPGSGVAKETSGFRLQASSGKSTEIPDTEAGHLKPEARSLKPNWIVAAERVETTRKYLRTVARIEPDWIEPLASHLVNKSYIDPHWSPETGHVHAYEKVSLFGLTIVPRRRVNYGAINPKDARELFINGALVDGELLPRTEEFDSSAQRKLRSSWPIQLESLQTFASIPIVTKLEFFKHNQNVREEAKALQAKLRRHDFLLGSWAIYDFYQARIPETVYDRTTLETWCKTLDNNQRRNLLMTVGDVAREDAGESTAALYPNTMPTLHETGARIEYVFNPGETNDGLTVIVPLEGLREIEPARLGWLVPGLLEQKVGAMLRALPKHLRRPLVPIPDTAKAIVQKLRFGEGSIEEAVARQVSQIAGERVTIADFATERLPNELVMNIRVVGNDGKPITEGRQLETLRQELGMQAAASVAAINDPVWGRDNVTTWDFGDFPETLEVARSGMRITAYPALVDRRESVSLRLANSPEQANRQSRLGVMRLFQLAHHKELKTQTQWLPDFEKLKVYAQGLPEFDLKRDVADLLAIRALELDEKPLPRSELMFNGRVQQGKTRIGVAVQEVTRLMTPLLENFQQVRLLVEQHKKSRFQTTLADVKAQVNRLLPPGFLQETNWQWLREYPRYLKAIIQRFGKLKSGGELQDVEATNELARWQSRYEERLALHETMGITDPELETFRWMLEEYRVSLFAQKLGTLVKVSGVRLEKQFEKTRA